MPKICLYKNVMHEIGVDPLPHIEVIAHHLAYTNRYNGAVGTYSVAQHSVLCADGVKAPFKLAALLHDAPEAVYGDISSPIKWAIASGGLAELEKFYHDQLDATYGIETRCPEVKDVDLRMLITEAKSFGMPLEHFPSMQPFGFKVTPWTPEVAKAEFISTFYRLLASHQDYLDQVMGDRLYQTRLAKQASRDVPYGDQDGTL